MFKTQQNEKVLKITFVMNILCEGAGMINRERAMAEELAKQGHEVTILSYFKPTAESMPVGVTVRTIIPSRYRTRLYAPKIMQPFCVIMTLLRLLLIRPDWVCVDQAREARWVRFCRKALSFKVLYTYHGIADARFYEGQAAEDLKAERTLSHQELKKVDRVVVVSDHLIKETNRIGVNATRIHNGVQRDQFNPSKARIDINKPAQLVIGINRYTPFKGIENLINAFAITHRSCPYAQLWLYGYQDSQDYIHELKTLIEQHGLTHHVQLNGPLAQEEMAATMGMADVFANGSTDENFCMPLLEAQACGTPCVGFSAGGVSEVINDEVTGYLAKEGDPDGYAFRLTRLLSDPTLCHDMSVSTQCWVSRFEYSRLAKQLLNCMCSDMDSTVIIEEGALCHV